MRWGWLGLAVFLGALVGGYLHGRHSLQEEDRAAAAERMAAPAQVQASTPAANGELPELPSDDRSRFDSLPPVQSR